MPIIGERAMRTRLHPLFAAILNNIEAQPAMLHRAEAKASARRFNSDAPISAFAAFDSQQAANDCRDETGESDAHKRTDFYEREARADQFGSEL